MRFVWPMTTVVLVIAFFDNGNVEGNNLEIQVNQKLKEMIDLKEHLESVQKDIEKYISSFSNNNGLMKLKSMVQALAQEKGIRINFGKKIESMLEAYRQQLADLATTVENIDRHIENRLLANTNATEVSFRSKIKETVSTIEETFTGSMSKLNQTLGNLYEQFNQWRVPKQVNGRWTAWGSWTRCTSSCGVGVRTRVRTCTNPAPANGGNGCVGDALEHSECFIRPCQGISHCSGGWEEYQGSCYWFRNETQYGLSWRDAQEFCKGVNADLLRIDNQMEFEFIQRVLLELHDKQLKMGVTPLSGYWTGGNDLLKKGEWVWSPIGQKMRFTIWWPGEPNDEDKEENCVELNRHMWFKMNDAKCWYKVYFICEKLLFTYSLG